MHLAGNYAPAMQLRRESASAPIRQEIPKQNPLRIPASKRPYADTLGAREKRKRATAANKLLTIVHEASDASSLFAEHGGGSQPDLDAAYVRMLAGDETLSGFEHQTLQKAVAAWKRWLKGLEEKRPEEIHSARKRQA